MGSGAADPLLIAVMGQTASGKTALAEGLAERFDAQLINADAFQTYRGMDIGTAKPAARERYRLLDLKNPSETYGVGEFCVRAAEVLDEVYAAGRSAIVVGGTGQYVRALFEEYRDLMPEPDPRLRESMTRRLREEGLPALVEELRQRDPEMAARTELQNPVRVTRALERLTDKRPPLVFRNPYVRRIKVSTVIQKDDGEARIALRTASMMHNGWVEEVRGLLADGYGPGDPGFRAIGYRTIAAVLDGDLATEEAERAIVQETISYAKRQRTWLRSEPGLHIFVPGSTSGLQEAYETIRDESLEI
ncbi:tRNA (adenosine(37)-N6)-dimethylallyltransferase MiaA [bacterium]|nr:MAG: tRNA (adenosine(37)-N6)-dimethylallyltransferase MiaA [bacterium]